MQGLALNRFLLIFITTPILFETSNCWETGRFYTTIRNYAKNPNVLIFDQYQVHSEVRFAIVQALTSVPIGNLQITLKARRYQEHLILNQIVGDVAKRSFHSNLAWSYYKTLNNSVMTSGNTDWTPILSSCDKTSSEFHDAFVRNSRSYQTICLSHLANMIGNWSNDELELRIRHFNYTFLTLSHHVTNGLGKFLKPKLSSLPPIHTFVPVFRYNRSEEFGKNWLEPRIVIQGDIESKRRNYGAFFASLKKHLDTFPQLKIQLIGAHRERLNIPRELVKNIEIHSNLPYPAYYDLISRAIAIVPAFQTRNGYFHNRASSTIPVSIITCVPIVADERILEAYAYLNPSVVWYREGNETEMDTLIRYFKEPNFPAVFEEKRQLLTKLRASLIKQNSALLKKIIFNTSI